MQLLLCGGGSGEQDFYAIKKLNEIIDHSKPILYIPLALDEEDFPYNGCYEWIQGELKDVSVPRIDMARSFEELAMKNYNDYSALFIGGGNTYKLLKGIKENGIFLKMKEYLENDGIVIGSSAGAVIFGKDIDIISSMDSNDVTLEDTTGFDVMNGISIFPHYTNKRLKLTEDENMLRHNMFTNAIIKYSINNGDVIAIPEEDAIYVNDNMIDILGTRPFYYFSNGVKHEQYLDQNIKLKIMK